MVGGAGSGAAENHLRRGVRRTDMAYQPKFARKDHRVSPFFVLLGVIVVPISLALTAVLLGKMAQSLSRPKATAQAAPENMTIMAQFDGFVSAKMDAAGSPHRRTNAGECSRNCRPREGKGHHRDSGRRSGRPGAEPGVLRSDRRPSLPAMASGRSGLSFRWAGAVFQHRRGAV